jgi:zinc protease
MRRILPLWLALTFLVPAFAAPIPFPHESSDLKMDPTATFGTLPNGLRYVVRANREPKERASLRLLIEAGAVHEADDQQGLAHFLEHMAFNGSKHFPPSSLIEFFQRMGMNFGGDTNASTSFNRTLYLLELPDPKEATLAEGLKVFRDYADGLLLKLEEIDRERGIILSEKRTRDSVGYRTSLATRNFLLQDTLFARRDIIGPENILKESGREKFTDFYDSWYRPELMSLVVVGDIDVPTVVKQIESAFRSLEPRGPARAQPDLGRVRAFEGLNTFHHYESEASDTDVTIMTITPYAREPDTAANRIKYLPRQIAHAILSRRLSILAKQENAPFRSGSSYAGESLAFYRQTSVALTCRADQWSAALAVADQELRRALEHGFQAPELQEVIANYRNSLVQAVKTASTRRSSSLAGEIASSLLDREVWTTPADDLALYGPALEKITVEACHAALRDAWNPEHRLVLVTGNAKLPAGDAAQAAIAAAYEKSRAVPVTAPAKLDDSAWAYTDFGAPGRIAKREHIADLDVTLLTFENGVRLNLKRTDFEANRIRMSVRIGNGQLTEPRGRPGLGAYLSQTYNEGGLGRHSADDLRRILAGKNVGAGFGASQDAFVVNGATNREDLLLQLQLVTARLTDPGFRPEAARQAKKALDDAYLSFVHTAGGPFNLEIAPLLASGDPRFGLPRQETMNQRNLDEVKAHTFAGPRSTRSCRRSRSCSRAPHARAFRTAVFGVKFRPSAAHGIDVLEIDRRRHDAVVDRQHGRKRPHRARATEQVSGHRFHAADVQVCLVLGEHVRDRRRLLAVAAGSRGGVRRNIIDVRRAAPPARAPPHRARRALGARRERGQMIRVGRRAVAAQLGVDPRAALRGACSNSSSTKYHRSFAEHEAVAVLVVGPRRPRRGVVARRERAHLRKGADRQRGHGRLRAAGHHDVSIAARDRRRGFAQRVSAGRAGRGDAHVGTAEIQQQAHLAGEQVGRDLDDEERRDLPKAARLPRVVHRFHFRQPAQADAEIDAHALGRKRRPVRIEAGIGIRLDRRAHTEVREAAEFLQVLLAERLGQCVT